MKKQTTYHSNIGITKKSYSKSFTLALYFSLKSLGALDNLAQKAVSISCIFRPRQIFFPSHSRKESLINRFKLMAIKNGSRLTEGML